MKERDIQDYFDALGGWLVPISRNMTAFDASVKSARADDVSAQSRPALSHLSGHAG